MGTEAGSQVGATPQTPWEPTCGMLPKGSGRGVQLLTEVRGEWHPV